LHVLENLSQKQTAAMTRSEECREKRSLH